MWVRQGDCPPEVCQGRCCKHLGFWLDSPSDQSWLKARGLATVQMGERFLVDIPQVCPHLTKENLCDIYGQPSRPQNCSDWPTEPSQTLLDDCGFSFVWEEDTAGVT